VNVEGISGKLMYEYFNYFGAFYVIGDIKSGFKKNKKIEVLFSLGVFFFVIEVLNL